MILKNDDSSSSVEIDKLIHEPARLLIMSQLFVVETADAIFLQRQTGLTWGNLSSHMVKLEEAGYISVEKEIVGRKPRTTLKLTPKGRQAFLDYRKAIKQVLEFD